ncbi:acylphosphatase [Nitratidesulfovibrio vulgaris]|jgi:acylphosphatase|uniref:Acylphosphatase n=2 Tax=Nitratidesulfovibrio vulgaris TaxID=881 RepID=ACYP_NITV2|nr:acylphosphatase [Nitratidesulfovibrio vulgaris]A1VEL6.1 RecName: Full=Acylphosphatase; AltName: Full=Acylphosphate phosphohydrolase [Nitratidesulfovibrio vulgaris DP4]Q72CU1.1 RecName: Full=Acylphosphatase; AltName: Full=Acylphosphate phosphohydrolase [Nitratidesulfovibrio vulgaris str. Hildenborough]GEB78944.1 acylphosphatase [Desulfovibrio desulfuricans]HBW16570.1 acylphosphatase [Desulfovibrio sp.]AAS95670.1 acylphosphatase [Nitratidesulfovibrio vulgaris str. Hildenborough]ABM28882.1 ac
MPRRSYSVIGRVQGVGFRSWTRRTALRLDLRGWVRNEPDGTVRLCADGTDEALATLETALRKGPMFSRVDHVVKHDDPAHEGPLPDTFDIRFRAPGSASE